MEIGCCAPISKYQDVSDAGFDYFEIAGFELAEMPYIMFKQFLEITNMVCLPVTRINAYCGGSPVIVGDAFDPAAVRSYARELFIRANLLGVETVGIGAPKARILPEGYDMAKADAQCKQFLQITCEEAADLGINVLLEAVHPGYCNYLNDTEKAVEIIEALNISNLELVLDLYNMKRNGEDWNDIAKYLPHIRHMHISTDLGGTSRGVYFDSDAAEVSETVSAIKKSGYSGTVSIEPEPSRVNLNDIKRALQLVRAEFNK